MTRVLHLLDQADQIGQAAVLRLSADVAATDHRDERHAWLLLGGEALRDSAHAAGIDPRSIRLVAKPRGLSSVLPGAGRRIRALLDQADRVVCWSAGAAAITSRLGCGHAEARFGQATLCPFAQRIIRAAASSVAVRSGADREALRNRWGADRATIIVALLADRPGSIDTREALLATAFAFETLAAAKAPRSDIRLLCHPRSGQRTEASLLADLFGRPELVVQDAGVPAPWRVLAGCDLALAPDPLHAGLSILWADAWGLPVIAPPSPTLPLLGALEAVRHTQSSAAKHLAHPMTQWAFAHQPTALANQS